MVTDFQEGNRRLVAKEYSEAIECFVRHARTCPDDAAKAYAAAAECCLRGNIISSPVTVAPGVELVSEGDIRGAEHFFRLALQSDPGNLRALVGLSDIVPQKSEERLQLLERSVGVAPGTINLVALGDFYRSYRRDHARAYDLYVRAQQHDPFDGTAYQRLTDLCRRMGRPGEAADWSARRREAHARKPRVDGRGAA